MLQIYKHESTNLPAWIVILVFYWIIFVCLFIYLFERRWIWSVMEYRRSEDYIKLEERSGFGCATCIRRRDRSSARFPSPDRSVLHESIKWLLIGIRKSVSSASMSIWCFVTIFWTRCPSWWGSGHSDSPGFSGWDVFFFGYSEFLKRIKEEFPAAFCVPSDEKT